MALNIVLFEPQIPPNTGNIGRLCVATKTKFHLIEPLAFDISEKAVRRAGLDYWKHVDLTVHKNYGEFRKSISADAQSPQPRLWFFTKFATQTLYEAKFQDGDYLIFGRETTGLSEEIRTQENPEFFLRIPILDTETVRSLNLAGAAHIALYEALRQIEFS